MKATELTEKWSKKYKDSINCSNPKGFSQKAHCAGRKKKTNEDTQQLNEAFPLLVPALATAVRLGAPVVSRLLSREGAKQVAKGVAKNAGKAALATGKAVVKNPGKTAAAYGAYEIWDTVNSAINFLEDIGLDDALVPTVAKVIVRYGIPAAAVIAALYGGKKLYDYLKSENSPENQEIIDAFEKEYGITESDLVVNRTQLVSYIKDAIVDWVETEQDVDRLADLLRQTVGQQIHSRGNKFVITKEDIDQAFALLKPIQESGCPRTKATNCQCESVNKLSEDSDTLSAVCVLEHSDTVKGTMLFKQTGSGPTFIAGKITGLEPGEHGFHIHEYGDLSKGCESAGAHYNPDGVDHGDLEQGHVGDLGNITADENGVAVVKIIAERVDLAGDRSVVGRSIIVHSDEDDLGQGGDAESLKTGNAGDRLACGVITLKENVKEEAAGVGIVTKQNATADVPVGGEYQNVKKLFPKKRKKK